MRTITVTLSLYSGKTITVEGLTGYKVSEMGELFLYSKNGDDHDSTRFVVARKNWQHFTAEPEEP